MHAWMTLWYGLLGVTLICFLGMVLVVGVGAIGELRETLDELRGESS